MEREGLFPQTAQQKGGRQACDSLIVSWANPSRLSLPFVHHIQLQFVRSVRILNRIILLEALYHKCLEEQRMLSASKDSTVHKLLSCVCFVYLLFALWVGICSLTESDLWPQRSKLTVIHYYSHYMIPSCLRKFLCLPFTALSSLQAFCPAGKQFHTITLNSGREGATEQNVRWFGC